MTRGRFKLTKAERIRKSQEFQQVFKRGERINFPEFNLVFARNNLDISRMGVGVGKRFGNAVKRNRAKRLCRELFRLNKYKIPKGIDLIFLPKKAILESSWQELNGRIEEAGRKIAKRIHAKRD